MSSKKPSGGKTILNNVKISALILLLAVVSITSIGGMSILGIKNMNSLDKDTDVLYYEKMAPTMLIENVEIGLLKIRMNVVTMFSGYDESTAQKIHNLDKEINKLMEDYEKTNLSDEEKAGLEEFKKSYQNYLSHWYSIKDRAASGAIISNEDKDIFEKYSEDAQGHVESLVEYNLSSAEEMVENATIVFDRSLKIFITFLIAISIIFVAFSFIILTFIKKNMVQVNDYLHRIAEYEFNLEINEDGKNEFSEMRRSLMKAVDNIRKAIGEVREDTGMVTHNAEGLATISEEMASSSHEVATTIEELSGGAASQAQELSDVVNLIADLTVNIDTINGELKEIRLKADKTVDKASLGQKEIGNLIRSVEDIRKVFGLVVEKVSSLNNTVAQIGNITDVITGISEQTNLLALNAAIEAARAGEMGRGFAVVADEVRKLAEDSKKSTDEISMLISSINEETNAVIKTSDEMESHVRLQSNAAGKAAESFVDILESIQDVAPLIEDTYESMMNTIKAKDKVLKKVKIVSSVTEENSAASEEVAASSEELSASSQEVASAAQTLNDMAAKLIGIVELFKI